MAKQKESFIFRCPNPNCNKEIKPLMFFDGSTWCPECKKNLLDSITMGESSVESDVFAISQEYFARYLLGSANGTYQKEDVDYLQSAIGYCRKAAYKGNPYALYNLGYYYELGYDETIHRETGQSFARTCYQKIVTNANAKNEELKEMAKRNLLLLNERVDTNSQSNGMSYMNTLIPAIKGQDKSRTPLLGAFCICDVHESDRDKLTQMLKTLTSACKDGNKLYHYNIKKDKQDVLHEILINDLGGFVNRLIKYGEKHYVVYRNINNKGTKNSRKYVQKFIRMEKEFKQTMCVICDIMNSKGWEGMDFSDCDLLICSFIDGRTDIMDTLLNKFRESLS